MRAALRLRHYRYSGPQVIHDEGRVIGFQQADQSEDQALAPAAAAKAFFDNFRLLDSILSLVQGDDSASIPTAGSIVEPAKYRTATAFIMMWMDAQQPELIDVADAVKEVFRQFGIRAVRADDIEHEGLITDRVIDEIRTAEFLFADLTGARPNVYYEVGYGRHALGKRVILFRKAGTGLHFDLAGYNCPEYDNLRNLREQLTKRLIEVTNKKPSRANESDDPA